MENESLEAITSPISTELKNGKQFYTYTKEDVEIIERELKAKANLVSMCDNLAKLVGLKEKDYVELETLITNKLKALEIIRNIGILKPYETIGGQCWLETMCDATKITKDNCDLLKEVLNGQ